MSGRVGIGDEARGIRFKFRRIREAFEHTSPMHVEAAGLAHVSETYQMLDGNFLF